MAKKQGDIRSIQAVFDQTTNTFLGLSDPASPGDGVDVTVATLTDAQSANSLINGVAGVGNGIIYDEDANEITLRGNSRAILAPVTQSTFGNGATSVRTTYGKFEAERTPKAVRMVIRSLAPITLADWKCAIAATESFADDTNANKFYPVVGGVSYNSAVDTTTGNGWVTASFTNGTTGTTWVGSGDASAMYVAVGPWMQVNDVPRSDGGSTRMFLFRATHINTSTYSIKTSSTSAGSVGGSPESRKTWLRVLDTVDGIADFSQIPSSATSDTNCVDIGLEFDFGEPVESVLIGGDSISANYEYIGWALRAVWAASTPERPMIPNLVSRAGAASDSYIQNLINYVTITGAVPTTIIVPVYSPNGDYTNDFSLDKAKFNIMRLIRWAKDNRIKVIMWDGTPFDTSDAPRQARMTALRNFGKELAANGLVSKYVEMARVITSNYDSGSPERYISGLSSDGLHPTQPATDLMWPVMAAALKN